MNDMDRVELYIVSTMQGDNKIKVDCSFCMVKNGILHTKVFECPASDYPRKGQLDYLNYAIKQLKYAVELHVYSNQMYLRNFQYISIWNQNNWKKKDGKQIRYKEEWQSIYATLKTKGIKMLWNGDDFCNPVYQDYKKSINRYVPNT